ncbi:MAG: magnesium transporter [Candidatus Hinthialibacter antarcticus]|nr:magnesium transporter [Candidatus Hinthialibacter antarcticus]
MPEAAAESWKKLLQLIETKNPDGLKLFLDSIEASESTWAISHLSEDNQKELLSLVAPDYAAWIIELLDNQQAAELLEEMAPDQAAAIVEEMKSDDQADILCAIDSEESNAILDKLSNQNATDIRALMQYLPDSAGGLMNTEVLSFTDDKTIGNVYDEISQKGEVFSDFDIQYIYVVTKYEMLVGVLRLRDLLFRPRDTMIVDAMIPYPIHVQVDDNLKTLAGLFSDYDFLGVPVTDNRNRLVGILHRNSVHKASEQKEGQSFLRVMGIVGGEELRSMPVRTRSSRRLSWLSINIVLNLIAASVIAMYEETLTQVIALAFFLPIISDMSGCSGNQAVAVSMRELNKGILKPKEVFYTLMKEFPIGIMNGTVLGILIGCIAALWQWNLALGAVVGLALAANTVVSVCLGGSIPLILRALKLDPALVSSPVLTTVTDMCGFFFVLSFAAAAMDYII